jgi:hypothetical protein
MQAVMRNAARDGETFGVGLTVSRFFMSSWIDWEDVGVCVLVTAESPASAFLLERGFLV